MIVIYVYIINNDLKYSKLNITVLTVVCPCPQYLQLSAPVYSTYSCLPLPQDRQLLFKMSLLVSRL